ncbi:MAG: signal peptidase I [bacterium]|nr:signal peptidase I [bacterium]
MGENDDLKDNLSPESGYDQREVVGFFWEVVKMVVLSLAIIVPIRYFVIQPFFVKGASMEESFHNGDYVLIDEISYRFNEPQRGDVVVFRFPQDPSQYFIKRIIGLPGEKIQIKSNEVLIFNEEHPEGFILDESAYLENDQRTTGDFSMNVDEKEYFVLGDNRMHSSDSRIWGAVNRQLISGRVFLRAWPITDIGTFSGVQYLTPQLAD